MTKYLLDTNLLLLLIIGGSVPKEIGKHKRLSQFETGDLELLNSSLRNFSGLVTLPHVLAETSNLIGIGREKRKAILNTFGKFLETAEELDVKSSSVLTAGYWTEFGLTDAAIMTLKRPDICVVTVDHGLFGMLQNFNVDVINLWHEKWKNSHL